jgi:hypothetical protein
MLRQLSSEHLVQLVDSALADAENDLLMHIKHAKGKLDERLDLLTQLDALQVIGAMIHARIDNALRSPD